MLGDEIGDPPVSPTAARDRLLAAVRDVVESAGRERIEAETDVAPETVSAVAAGGDGSIPLAEAAAILAIEAESRSGEAILEAAREELLLSMSTAMLDVDTLAGRLEGDLDPSAIQAKLEGRFPMTVDEYGRLWVAVEDARDRS